MITLAKALKLKNRIVQKISKLQSDIQTNNSTLAGSIVEIDVNISINKLKSYVDQLIDLKVKIATANIPVVKNILLLAELKSANIFLQGINTRRGKIKISDYSENCEEYVTVLTKADVDAQIKRNETSIDATQEMLDMFNALTKIDFEFVE